MYEKLADNFKSSKVLEISTFGQAGLTYKELRVYFKSSTCIFISNGEHVCLSVVPGSTTELPETYTY